MVGVAHQVPMLHAHCSRREGVLVRSVEQEGVVGQGAVGVVRQSDVRRHITYPDGRRSVGAVGPVQSNAQPRLSMARTDRELYWHTVSRVHRNAICHPGADAGIHGPVSMLSNRLNRW